jgi:hypothetical protein
MKKTAVVLWIAAACSLGAAERYQSAGFSAEITANGVIRNLEYAGQPLASSISLTGEYKIPEGAEKYDARFFQTTDYSGKAKFQRDAETLTVSIDSTLDNKGLKDAASYRVNCVMKPNEIVFSCEVVQKVELLSDYHIFKTHIQMPGSLFGRGARVLTSNDQEEFKVLPETYEPKFRLNGKEFSLSTGKGVLAFTGDPEVRFGFMDSRTWGGNDFTIVATPFAKWTPKPVAHPAGTVWKWNFKLTFTPDR